MSLVFLFLFFVSFRYVSGDNRPLDMAGRNVETFTSDTHAWRLIAYLYAQGVLAPMALSLKNKKLNHKKGKFEKNSTKLYLKCTYK